MFRLSQESPALSAGTTMTLDEVNRLSHDAFVDTFGSVFEHSPWVAREAWAQRPFATVEALLATMVGIVKRSDASRQLALIRAHPDLAGRAKIADLSAASAREQIGAGLDRCTTAEYQHFHRLNVAYRRKFGFPFIIAVTGRSVADILEQFERRMRHDRDQERSAALREIARIAEIRLDNLIDSGR